MSTRFRFVTALLALFAFSAYFAEGVWAATCPPEMPNAGIEEDTPPELGEPGCPMAESRSAIPSGPPDTSDHPGSEAPRCPLGFVGAGGSCVSVSLPATTSVPLLSVQSSAALSLAPQTTRDLLLTAALFHPPRA